MTRYELPDVADLIRLGEPHENAITVYAETAPGPDEREKSVLTAKSAVDRALRAIRDSGARHAVEERLRSRWNEIAGSDLWLSLSRSVAIFIADDFHEVYVLPNNLENQLQVGSYFDIGQLVRAVTTPQEAFALTLSADGWNLWQATATTRAEELELTGEYAVDVADATNRATVRDRGHVRRLVGDEGKKVLLEQYAKRVADAVDGELGQLDPSSARPLYLFATDPLLDMYRALDHKRQIVAVPGAADLLRPDQIDGAIRESLPALNAEQASAWVDELATTSARGWSPPISAISPGPRPPAPWTRSSTTSPSTWWAGSRPPPAPCTTTIPAMTCCRASRSPFSTRAVRPSPCGPTRSPQISGIRPPSRSYVFPSAEGPGWCSDPAGAPRMRSKACR